MGNGKFFKVKLDRETILCYNEDDFFDTSTLEAVYTIRQMRALLSCGAGDIMIVEDPRSNGTQVFLEDYDVWVPILSIEKDGGF